MTTIFTNGCFDVLHVGHLRLLAWAKAHGDILIVGINSDASIKRLKGPGRPIVSEGERIETLIQIRSVDQAIVFDEDTPERLIKTLRPDALVKGPDWRNKEIAGADFVIGYGGRILIPDWPIAHSTTDIIERILQCS